MKQILIVILVFIISSCNGTKKVVETTSKEETVEVVKPKTTQETIATKVEEIDVKVKEIQIAETPIIVKEPTTTVEETPVTVEEPTKIVKVISQETIIPNAEAFNHNAWNDILKKHVSKLGNVNYNSIKSNRKELTNYIASLGDNMPNNTWVKEDKLAYWINAYNAMTVDLIVRNMPIKSIKNIKDPWDQRLWKLGSKWYNLDQIENKILRKMDEPRIHFAIVCASFSCPKLQNEAFTASKLETQLTNATRGFLSDTKRNKISENRIELSKIFKWFKKDFEQNSSLTDFLSKYLDITVLDKAKKSYLDYNWYLND